MTNEQAVQRGFEAAQVIDNPAYRNAMDALAETEEGLRRVTIRTANAGGSVELSVCDTGAGLSPEAGARPITSRCTGLQ